MPIQPDTTFGPYQVESFIGAGGMGEVYRARDGRLNRLVALKVLPPERVADPERRQRFIQEAQLASSLQHPNIVTIYDVGAGSDGSEYLAMELVQGQTLDTVIPAKGLRLTDALRYGVQIADALAAAHRAGVLHRDLKPGNIMVTDQGQIKILDFGLATLVDLGPTHGEPDETRAAPTLVQTGAGTILGTVAYMSPEQAEGKTVDGRSDIFSLGAILYEMLSGQRAFAGDSAAATIAAVMTKEPQPLSQMAAGAIPQPVERLVTRCLRKDLSRRAQHASDVKIALEELQEDSASGVVTQPASERRTGSRNAVVIGGLAAAGVIAAAAFIWWPRTEPLPAAFLSTPLTSLTGSETNPSFSPDGTQVAFQWTPDGAQSPDVYVQLVTGTGARLRLSNDGHSHEMPAWSPDGQWIAMWQQTSGTSGHQLTLISPLGGPERTLLAWDDLSGPIAWSPDNRWLATSPVNPRGTVNKGLVLLSPETGERVDWITVDPLFIGSAEPSFSPDGTRLAYTRTTGDFTGQLNVVSIGRDGRPAGAPVTVAYKGQELHFPVWTADGQSLLLVEGSSSSNGGVTRIPLDAPERAQRLGGLEHVKRLALSHDGTKLVFSRGGDDSEIWRFNLRDPSKSGPVASSTLWDGDAQYSPDGRRIAFASNRSGGRELWVGDADGSNAQPVTHFDGPVAGTPRWSPDGRQLAFDGRPEGNSDVFVVSVDGGPVRQLTRTPGEDARPAWAADGQSIYFSSGRSGRPEIWRMDVAGENPVQITRNGALAVLASPERPYLFYKRFGSGTPVYRIREDGTEDEAFSEPSFAFLPFAVTASGLWFIGDATTPLADWAVFVKRFADRKTAEVATFDWEPNGLAISVSPDERYVLVTKQDTNGTDLRLVNGFR